MTSGYTEAELDTLVNALLDNQPAYPSVEEIKSSFPVTGAAIQAQFNGLLLRLSFQSRTTLFFNLNCVVASELMSTINHAYNAWPAGSTQVLNGELGFSTTEESCHIISFAVSADANGLPVNFTDGVQCFFVYLPSSIAMGILIAINAAGESAGWWDTNHVLQPARRLEEVEIQREAAMLMSSFRNRAGSEASQRADRAMECGDKFRHDLWIRVAAAVAELERNLPPDY